MRRLFLGVFYLLIPMQLFGGWFWPQLSQKFHFTLEGGGSEEYVTRKEGGTEWICTRQSYSRSMQKLISHPKEFISEYGGLFLKVDKSKRKSVRLIEIDGRKYVLKEYHCPTPWCGIKQLMKVNGAFTSWNNAHRLIQCEVPTPKPHLALFKRDSVFKTYGILLMEYIEGIHGLDALFEGAVQLEEIFSALHTHRLVHGDLKPDNFIYDGKTLHLIDLDRMYQLRQDNRRFERVEAKDRARFIDKLAAASESHNQLLQMLTQR